MARDHGGGEEENPDCVYGIHPVETLLREQPEQVSRVAFLKGSGSSAMEALVALAKGTRVPYDFVPRERLTRAAGTDKHQGVVATVAAFAYADLDDVIAGAAAQPPGLVLVLDNVEDPRNLGAIIRTAEALGAHGIVIPKRRAASVTALVAKVAAGALVHLPVARAENISQALEALKQHGFWVFGLDAAGKEAFTGPNYSGPTALVLGAEGKGLRPLVARHCDALVHIPLKGKTPSLNVSVAAAMALFAVVGQREGWGTRSGSGILPTS